MPTYRMWNGFIHLKLGGKLKKNPPKHCVASLIVAAGRVRCNAMASLLCDWPVEGGTCDAPLCADCAVQVGADMHFCPLHAKQVDANEKAGGNGHM